MPDHICQYRRRQHPVHTLIGNCARKFGLHFQAHDLGLFGSAATVRGSPIQDMLMPGHYNLMLAGQILASRLDIASQGGKHDSCCFEPGEPAGILRAIDASNISIVV